jgi:hypothetical protein
MAALRPQKGIDRNGRFPGCSCFLDSFHSAQHRQVQLVGVNVMAALVAAIPGTRSTEPGNTFWSELTAAEAAIDLSGSAAVGLGC